MDSAFEEEMDVKAEGDDSLEDMNLLISSSILRELGCNNLAGKLIDLE